MGSGKSNGNDRISWHDVHRWSKDLRVDTDGHVIFHITPNFTTLGSEKFTVTLVLCKKLTNVWTAADIVVTQPWPNINYQTMPAMMIGMLWDARAKFEERENEAARQASF